MIVLVTGASTGIGCAGLIAAVTSQSGRLAHPTQSAYAGSKFAAEAALEAPALEVAPLGIRVRIVEPGLTFTAAQEKMDRRLARDSRRGALTSAA